ncbi:MAG TPA: T9SS type A sorting domain-containing protein, partial [Puia sp.]
LNIMGYSGYSGCINKVSGDKRIVVNMEAGGLDFTLRNFKGVITDQKQVELSWATLMEANVDHYEIERSGDGVNFVEIDEVKSKMTIVTNDYQLNYKYEDSHVLLGISFYRVKVIGKDGITNQTAVIQISNSSVEGTRIYPTVIQNNMVFVESDKNLRTVKIEFFDLSGNKISETNWNVLNGRQTVQVSRTGVLATGTYIARLTANGESIKNQQMIVQNH